MLQRYSSISLQPNYFTPHCKATLYTFKEGLRLSASDRLALSRRLRESVNETDSVRQARVASEIDRFFGGWSDDPRTTDEILQQIREGRTENTYPKF